MQSHEPIERFSSMLEAGIVPTGTILDGRFRIEGLIGHGGMGYVLAAIHLELQQRVAIKLLSPGREQKEQGASRLSREARASARIHSEHVVRVLDVVQSQTAPPYIVLEYLEGEDLARRLKRGRLEIAEAVEVVLQACEAIGEAHRLGIVHRDLKPSNLFLCSRGGRGTSVKVLDFGISKMDEAGASLTQSHALLGSPIYAAPEQLRSSHQVDARADIWSLGILLYECVTGTRPFEGQTLAQVCTSILHDSPRAPRDANPQLPSALEAVLLRCLRREPALRYQSIEELVRALHDLAPRAAERCASYLDHLPPARQGRTSQEVIRQPARAEPSDTLTGSAEYESHDGTASSVGGSSTQRRRAQWGIVSAGVALAALVAWQIFQTSERPPAVDLAAHSETEARPSEVPVLAAVPPKPSPSSPALAGDSLSPATPPTASQRPVNLVPPRVSPRTAGPRLHPSAIAHPVIAPWVDTR